MRAQSVYTIVEHMTAKAQALGMRPQMITTSIKKLSEETGLHRDTIRGIFKDPKMGFIERNSAWKIGKDYKWAELEKVWKGLPNDVSKIIYWQGMPDFDFDNAGIHRVLTKEEARLLSKVRRAIADGANVENINIVVGTAGNNEGLSAEEKELIEKFRASSNLAQKNTLEMLESAVNNSHAWEESTEKFTIENLRNDLDVMLAKDEDEEKYITILKWALAISVYKTKLFQG